MTSAQVAAALGVPRAQVADELNRAKLQRLKVASDTYVVTQEALETTLAHIESELLAFHDCEPTATGISTAALRDRIDRRLAPKVFDALLDTATTRGFALAEKGSVRHPKAAVSALAAEADAEAALLPLLESQGLAPAGVAELAAAAGVESGVARKVLGRLATDGAIVRVSSELHFSAGAIAGARARLEAFLEPRADGATAAELRDALGVSRKYAIPLLEYFDAHGVTRRTGDLRMLR